MEKLLAIFRDLKESRTTEKVNRLLREHGIDEKFIFNEDTYPRLKFTITKDEIDHLIQGRVLTHNYCIASNPRLDTLGKLLYALAWKIGDILKIKHIIEGISSEPDHQADDAIIFNQFGRHLSGKPNEPIIDQHAHAAFYQRPIP